MFDYLIAMGSRAGAARAATKNRNLKGQQVAKRKAAAKAKATRKKNAAAKAKKGRK